LRGRGEGEGEGEEQLKDNSSIIELKISNTV
jgi:hypothetical protein